MLDKKGNIYASGNNSNGALGLGKKVDYVSGFTKLENWGVDMKPNLAPVITLKSARSDMPKSPPFPVFLPQELVVAGNDDKEVIQNNNKSNSNWYLNWLLNASSWIFPKR